MKAIPVVIPEEDEDEEVPDGDKDDQRGDEQKPRPKTVRIAAESTNVINEEGSDGEDFIHNSDFAQKVVGVKGGKKWRRTMHANNFLLGDDLRMPRRTTAMV